MFFLIYSCFLLVYTTYYIYIYIYKTYSINVDGDILSIELLPPLIPMMVPRRPTGTEKFSLTFTTRSKRRNSASLSGITPCCCSKGWKERCKYNYQLSFKIFSTNILKIFCSFCTFKAKQQLWILWQETYSV